MMPVLPFPPPSFSCSCSCPSSLSCCFFLFCCFLLSPLLSSLPLRGALGALPEAASARRRAAKTLRQATLRSRLTTWTGL